MDQKAIKLIKKLAKGSKIKDIALTIGCTPEEVRKVLSGEIVADKQEEAIVAEEQKEETVLHEKLEAPVEDIIFTTTDSSTVKFDENFYFYKGNKDNE